MKVFKKPKPKPIHQMNFEYDSSNSRTICSTPLLTPVIIDGRLHHVPSPLSTTPFFSSSSKFSQFTITPNKNVQFTPLKPPSPPVKSKSIHNSNQQTPLTSCPPPLLPDSLPKIPPAAGNNTGTGTGTGAGAGAGTNTAIPAAPKRKGVKKSRTGTDQTPLQSQQPHKLSQAAAGKPKPQAQLPEEPKNKKETKRKEEPKKKMEDELGGTMDDEIRFGACLETEGAIISDEILEKGAKLLEKLLLSLALGFQHLCQFRCRDAISTFQSLPLSHYETGWVLSQIGRAHLELIQYQQGKEIFEKIRQLEPYRIEGMEIYSTILWYLRASVELSYLAHELVEFDRLAPESWCVVGNCFGLQKEHESALNIFKRAIQLDSSFTYAYTLSGHEYMANDDLEKAAVCFRNAIQIDDRHYNAWYGLGMIYYRQEKFDLAEFHFKKAVQINSINSVLYCFIGMVLQANHKENEALLKLEEAIKLNPHNNIALFKKAKVLTSLARYQEAIEQLLIIKDRSPKEGQIYLVLGRLYKRLNNTEESVKALTIAMDLDPKNLNYIKSIMDQPDDETEDIFDLS